MYLEGGILEIILPGNEQVTKWLAWEGLVGRRKLSIFILVRNFKRVKNQTHHNWFLINCGRLVTFRTLSFKLWIILWHSFIIQRIHSVIYSTSYANTYHDITAFEVDGVVYVTKNWISSEQNMVFPWNKKKIILSLRYHFEKL